MASTYTANIGIQVPARGDLSGIWDTSANPDYTLLDSVIGAIATISGAAGSVVLAAGQFQSRMLTVNSTLTASITLTFPTSFVKDYKIFNVCTGSSAFTITLATTAAGGQAICVPPGDSVDVYNDGTNLKFMNMGRVGSYWDYAGSSVPNWVSGCTVPPYLNCDGSTFSATTYPQLAVVMGSTTLPDSRGRFRTALNQGTGRITTAAGGLDGNTRGAAGGAPTITLGTGNLPPYTPSGAVTGTVSINGADSPGSVRNQFEYGGGSFDFATFNISAAFTGNAQGGASTPFATVPPGFVGGITMVRSA